RNTNELTHENSTANSDMREVENGRAARMYELFPELYMQCSKKVEYTHAPAWYKGIEYMKEEERGFSYKEDQLVPGWFEMPMKKGESVIFAAGISEGTVPLAVKSHLRGQRPVLLAFASNDALAASAKNLGELLVRRHYWFLPMRQDDPVGKPTSLVADFAQLPQAVEAALAGRQLRPLFL
ncbi:MAG: glycogen debranching enzyme N-terminal domain-containing protein, partial [Oscillospiraceae bacterium]|nr:glycogen debranching enzyme N-terminal domain-containing protein [Oscillospiraceae bacterium]